jgi:hypothetical protein
MNKVTEEVGVGVERIRGVLNLFSALKVKVYKVKIIVFCLFLKNDVSIQIQYM